ncbi:MAG: magnesium chelatase subunit D [Pseudomonadota bacterium]
MKLTGGPDSVSPGPVADALLAARLVLNAPHLFGGLALRGAGLSRDAVLQAMSAACIAEGRPWRRLPAHIDDERLLGGTDIAASLAAGTSIAQTGLLSECAGGILVVPMAERVSDAIAGRLAQALDYPDDKGSIALVLLDDGLKEDDTPPASLLDRVAIHCDLSAAREWRELELADPTNSPISNVAPLDDEALTALATTATALGVANTRPLLFAAHVARAHAAWSARSTVSDADLACAARLVIAPRATQMPPADEVEPPEPPSSQPSDDQENQPDNDAERNEGPLDDMLVEAALAAIPPDLLAELASGNAPRRTTGSGSGQKRKSGLRGKPLGARPGMPRGGARLALIDSLRAAVPWQPIRRRDTGENQDAPIIMRKEDLRIRRFEERAAWVTIFAVDASGSAAAARLAEAKGAVELMLSQAYVTRSEVALIAFRGETAELLLAPTRSLTRARRALAELPGGGGTPLALGLNAARECAEAVRARGRTASIVVLTDGRANIDADGAPGRKQAGEDAQTAAKAIARSGIDGLIVDISARPGREGPALAQAMGARFLALPRADAATLHQAIAQSQQQREVA